MRRIQIVVFLCFSFLSMAKDKAPFVIYNEKGKKVSYEKMLKHCKGTEITFFGEFHNNAIAHWLQLELTNDLTKSSNNKLILGFEMFESDQQYLFDKWQNGELSDRELEDSLRLWSNYKTDYKPLIICAKENELEVVASNIPRRLASIAFKTGREGLANVSDVEKEFMVPFDFPVDTTLSQYRSMFEMVGGDHSKGYNFVLAQAVKDATMAKFINEKWKNDAQFIHFNGSFHTDFDQGIIHYLKAYRPNLKYTTISTVEQTNIDKLDKEYLGKAKFIICVKENVTKTH